MYPDYYVGGKTKKEKKPKVLDVRRRVYYTVECNQIVDVPPVYKFMYPKLWTFIGFL